MTVYQFTLRQLFSLMTSVAMFAWAASMGIRWQAMLAVLMLSAVVGAASAPRDMRWQDWVVGWCASTGIAVAMAGLGYWWLRALANG